MHDGDPVSEHEAARISASALTQFAAAVLAWAGLRPEDAAVSAEILVTSDLFAIESHGVARLGYYLSLIEAGVIDLTARPVIERETPSTATIDAGNGFGPPAAHFAMAACVAKAKENGVAFVTVRDSNHFGIAGYYAMMAVAEGLAGLAATNGGPQAVPTNGRITMLGTNPLAVGIPAGQERPFLLDMATSQVSWGKIELARRAGESIPPGWALDAEARPTTDPWAADLLLPLGSDAAGGGHKGYGLASLVDILCGPFAGSAFGQHVAGMRSRRQGAARIGHFFAAWRPDAFRPMEEFRADVDTLLAELRATPPAPGHDRVYVAGEREFLAEDERRRHGIPLHSALLAELRAIAARASIPLELA
ncbi:MAG: Ldh family oxidoreductase [Thermomicrobiales bacterium]|nr:Ldh family oxidoreductase [Thermomicrobiales bacterium]